jgi:hypothetical protein
MAQKAFLVKQAADQVGSVLRVALGVVTALAVVAV